MAITKNSKGVEAIEYLIIGLLKLIDSLVTTSKSIFVHKNKPLLVAILIFISQILFYTVISQVVEDGSLATILIVATSASIGSYIAFPLNNMFSEDKTYINIITSKDKYDMNDFCEYLRELKIKNIILNTINKENQHTLAVIVFAKTKHQSKLIDVYVQNNKTKVLREIWD